MSDDDKEPCGYCEGVHRVWTQCPRIKLVEYYENGAIARIEFLTPVDQQPWWQTHPYSQPYQVTWQPPNYHTSYPNNT